MASRWQRGPAVHSPLSNPASGKGAESGRDSRRVPITAHASRFACPDRAFAYAKLGWMPRLAVTALCALAIAGCGAEDEPRPAAPVSQQRLAGAPAPLAALHEQANRLLPGGADAYRGRIKDLRGFPVVVNKWASWCPPCRVEFSYFRNQAVKRAKTTAFFGVDSNDNDADAREFLSKLPVSYPSYRDPDSEVAAVFKGVQAFPVTAFYDKRGRLAYLHQGGYASERRLAEDIDRYAR